MSRSSSARRSVLPPSARQSLWRASAWTGLGTMLVGTVACILVVAICWLPASGSSGSAGATIRAGTLAFLASVHAGITVSGLPTAFVPLGMTILVGLVAWRAGRSLAEAADEIGERRASQLVRAAVLQAGTFAVACGIAAMISPLGTSSVSSGGAAVAGFLLFAVTGGVAFIRWSPLADEVLAYLPSWVGRALRAAVAGIAAYLAAGALLLAGALVMHADRVQAISGQVGGGWSGIPILLLGVLAAPNAVIAGSAYAAGPGFALGSGAHVSAFSSAHGLLPAFPVLGAVPSGNGATWYVLLFVSLVPLVAGCCVAAAVRRADDLLIRLRDAAAAAGIAVVIGVLLAWQGGGAVGSGRLNSIGASPWQLGLAFGVEIGIASSLVLLTVAGLARLRRRPADPRGRGVVRSSIAAFAAGVTGYRNDDDGNDESDSSRADRLAG